MSNTIGLGEYKDIDLIEELKNRGVILYTKKQLELAKIEAKIEELDYAGKAISEAYVDYRLPELTKQKEEK